MRKWRSLGKGPPWHRTDTGSIFYMREELDEYVRAGGAELGEGAGSK